MANVSKVNGFMPVRHLSGGEIRVTAYPMDTNTAAALTKGDPVNLETGGNIEGCPAGTALLGVFAGCVYTDSAGAVHYSDYIPATKTGMASLTAFVWDDPNIVFVAQSDSDTNSPAATDVGAAFDHITFAAGNATTHISAMAIDTSTLSSSDGQWKCIGLYPTPDNAWGDYAKILVIPNEHILKAVAGV